MQLLSQRDNRWKDILLGMSRTTTIGSHGCVIACVSMAGGTTPDVVNSKLVSVGGYAGDSGNLIIWTKINQALPWLKFRDNGRYYAYDNTLVVESISKNGFCLVEVDGTPIGGTVHWVLYIGNKELIDPWDGKVKPTSSYRAIGFSIIDKVGEPPKESDMAIMYKGYDLTNQDSMKVAVDILVDVVKNNLYVKLEDIKTRYGVESLDQLDSQLSGYKSRITDLTKQLGIAQAEVTNKEEIISRRDSQLLQNQDDINTLIDRSNNQVKIIEELGKDKGRLAIEIEQLKIQVETLKQAQVEGSVTITRLQFIKLLLNQRITIRR